jgi:hypothetical protein
VLTTSARAIRWLAAVFAVTYVASTLLQVALGFDLFGAPPEVPETADLPTRLLAFQPFEQSRWPIEWTAALLVAATFAIAIVLTCLLAAHGRRGIDRSVAVGTLASGAVLGLGSVLLYVGAHDLATNVGYCDCGFKETEVIGRLWALMVIDGGTGWLRDGALILLAIGVAFAGRWLGGREMSGSWYTWSLLAAIALVSDPIARNVLPNLEYGEVIFPTITTVVVAIWALWIARSFAAREPEPA